MVNSDMVEDGTVSPKLNSHLYSNIVNNMSKDIEQFILSKDHLYSNGVALIQDLLSQNDPIFNNIKDKLIQLFAARVWKLYKQFLRNNIPCATQDLIKTIVMWLGSDYNQIQLQLNTKLPKE